MKTKILVEWQDLKSFKKVDGAPIVFPGFEEFEFFMYRLDGTHFVNRFGDGEKGQYVITEVKTGRAVGEPSNNAEQCYNDVFNILIFNGIEAVRLGIERCSNEN